MFIRSAIASAVFAAVTVGCTPPQAAKSAAINDKVYAVTPADLTVKGPVLSGALTEMKVVERIEDGSGRIDQPARLTGKLVLTNVSKDQSVRLVGGKLLYIDAQGKPIPLEDKRTEPTLKASPQYGGQERLDPGQDATQQVEAEFPVAALQMKHLKEIRLELLYIPSAYKQETMNFGVSVAQP
ncbi:MAG TPA: hypothetical protein VFA72_12940 [Burkholderiales bacterium]|nr:hypothetical protein [Burkholderiales bacterium]